MSIDVTSPPGHRYDAFSAEPAGAPTAEALFALRVSGAVARQLYDAGRELRFSISPTTRRVAVLVCDLEGAVLTRLTASRALEIATGEPILGGTR